MIYLDNHSATQSCQASLERMGTYLRDHWAAPFAPHRLGQESAMAFQRCEPILLELVGASFPDQCYVTSTGAEAVGQVFWSIFMEVARKTGKTHIILSELEDAVSMQCAKRLEELGCTIKIAPSRDGQIDCEALEKLISPRTALISATMAHGLTGVIQPIGHLVELAQKHKVLLHLDANYAVGKYPLDLAADYVTFSGDLIHSATPAGALFVKAGAPLTPLVLGSYPEVGAAAALAAAVQQGMFYLDTMALETVRLRDLFESLVEGEVLFQDTLRLPNTSLIAFPRVHQEALLYFLSRKGVFASMGGKRSARLSDETSLSFALSRMTTEEEIRKAAQIINEAVRKLRALSEAIL